MAENNQNLSQEEIAKRMQLMKDNCIFCKIIKKEIPSKIIFEDDICFAILDINPATTGHILLMPKEHYMLMPFVPDEVLGHLGVISKYLSDLLKVSFNPIDITNFIANGSAAGQKSQHFMMHIIPRYNDDGISFDISGKATLSLDELQALANQIKKRLGA